MAEAGPEASEAPGGAPSVASALPADLDRLRARATWLYFAEGLTQGEIAKVLGLSRVAVVRLIADARRRNEVRVTISSPLAELAGIERALEARFGIARAVAAPLSDPAADPMRAIAAAAGAWINGTMRPGLLVGVGWGRTLHATLPFIAGRTLDGLRVVSLLGGIAAARRSNPAEFAWAFAELFQGEGFLVPAPALVDGPETKAALLDRCGLREIFAMAERLDVALLSVGSIEAVTTGYRVGLMSEADRLSLTAAGAVGDVLYNFIDEDGRPIDHPVNARAMSVDLRAIRRTPERVLVSGGPDKVRALRGAIGALRPTVLVTDEATARRLLA